MSLLLYYSLSFVPHKNSSSPESSVAKICLLLISPRTVPSILLTEVSGCLICARSEASACILPFGMPRRLSDLIGTLFRPVVVTLECCYLIASVLVKFDGPGAERVAERFHSPIPFHSPSIPFTDDCLRMSFCRLLLQRLCVIQVYCGAQVRSRKPC